METKFEKLGVGYLYLGFAELRVSRFLPTSCLFDLMRYERAFFASVEPVRLLVNSVRSGTPQQLFLNEPLVVRLAKCSDRKPANWTTARVPSDERLSPLKDSQKLTPKCRVRAEITFTGTPTEIVMAMFKNQAFPATEPDAHAITASLYQNAEPLSVRLMRFSPTELPFVCKVGSL